MEFQSYGYEIFFSIEMNLNIPIQKNFHEKKYSDKKIIVRKISMRKN